MPKKRSKAKVDDAAEAHRNGFKLPEYLKRKLILQNYNINPIKITTDRKVLRSEESRSQECKYVIGSIDVSCITANLGSIVCKTGLGEFLTDSCVYLYTTEEMFKSGGVRVVWEKVNRSKDKTVDYSQGFAVLVEINYGNNFDSKKIWDILNYVRLSGDCFKLVINPNESSKDCMRFDVCINSKMVLPLTFASEKVCFSEARIYAYIVINQLCGNFLKGLDNQYIVSEIDKVVKRAEEEQYWIERKRCPCPVHQAPFQRYSKIAIPERSELERRLQLQLGLHVPGRKNPEGNAEEIDILADLSVEDVYGFVLNSYKATNEAIEINHPFLIPELRAYQTQAVNWMLECERRTDNEQNRLHRLYEEFNTKDGYTIYYHKIRGIFVNERFPELPLCKGGILADEMGLGKTVEVLACILLNPRKDIDATIQPVQNLDAGKCNFDNLPLINRKLLPLGKRSQAQNSVLSPTKNSKKKKKKLISPVDENSLPHQDPHSEENLECVCGRKYDFQNILQCSKCGLKQHATCVLAKPDVSDVDYMCPYCWVDKSKEPIKSRATLIVSPSVILFQWYQEIEKHIEKGKLKVLQYLGIKHHKFINPVDLADHDIILSSYEIFRKELSHVNVPHGETQRPLRHAKVFRTLPSPLLAIEWWRICLDEAQMVESVVTKTAQMAVELPSINRWCVTGTPMQKSFDDLYGLIYFLGLDPYLVKEWWNELISYPAYEHGDYTNLHFVLNTVMWRTTKPSVLNQINIPTQETIVHYNCLREVERVFYQDTQDLCRKEFEAYCGYGVETDLKNLNLVDLNRLLTPLRNLQKACCHFQLTGGKFADIQKKKMNVDELHEFLVKKAKYEAEEVNRSLIAGFNGLAGCFAIKKDYKTSCTIYKTALKTVKVTQSEIRTDATQQVHAYHNFAEIASRWCSESEQLDELKEVLETTDVPSFIEGLNQNSEIRCKTYLEDLQVQITSCRRSLVEANDEVLKIKSEFKCERKVSKTSMWYLITLESLKGAEEGVFIDRIKEVLMSAPGRSIAKGKPSISDNFNDVTGLRYQLVTLADQLDEARLAAKEIMAQVFTTPVKDELNRAIACHLREPREKQKPPAPRCLYCLADLALQEYQSKLFRFNQVNSSDPNKSSRRKTESNTDDEDKNTTMQGCFADSELEIILREICHYKVPYFEGKQICREDGDKEQLHFKALKAEFKALRLMWEKMFNYASAVDELDMCKMPMRLRNDDEKDPKCNLRHLIKSEELDKTMAELEYGIKEDEKLLNKKLRHLAYMNNLNKKENVSSECGVCRNDFQESWRVLQCGHSYCIQCIQKLCEMHRWPKLPCPICRETTEYGDIYYANKDIDAETDPSKDPFKGYYSAKISAIVTSLRDIQKEDPLAKTIVFSSFPGLLEILAESLKDNKIYFANIVDKKSFEKKENKLQKFEIFKTNPRVNVLLIPLSMGANGLNIIEATHVFLVEPVMDHSKVLQAIGRVHRIGQTKCTYVHKFIIQNTIEEKIYELFDKRVAASEGVGEPILVKDLLKLFDDQNN